jgi:hypothetical protein
MIGFLPMTTIGIGAILILYFDGARETDLALPKKNGCMISGLRKEHLLRTNMYVSKNRTVFIPNASALCSAGFRNR